MRASRLVDRPPLDWIRHKCTCQQAADLEASVGPFLLSAEFAQGDEEVTALCGKLASALSGAFGGAGGGFAFTRIGLDCVLRL